MKYTLIILVIVLCASSVYAQESPQEKLAAKIAKKMKDTLALSAAAEGRIYAVNMQLHQQKMAMRTQYANTPDSLRISIQRVENTRDSLYRVALDNDTKWMLYRSKKANLINNN